MMKQTQFTQLMILLLCSCSDGISSLPGYHSGRAMSDAIIGKWYSEEGDGTSYKEDTYTNTGIKYSNTYLQMYGYRPYQTYGKYTLTGNQISDNMTFDGVSTSVLSTYSIDSLNRYSLVTHSSDYGIAHYNRIIGTVNLHLGKEYNLEAAQYFAQYSTVIPEVNTYSVADESVLTIDASGTISPKLSGETYIKLNTSAGVSIIKASVSDTTSLWNDYSLGLGMKLSEIEKRYGKHYAYKNDSTILYCPQNYYVDSVKFIKNDHDIIDSVAISFSKEADDNLIAGNIKSTMVFVDSLNPNNLWYTDNSNYLMSTTSAKYEKLSKRLSVSYIEPKWDDKIEDFGLTYDELKKKYGYAVVYNGNSAFYGNIIKNEFISQIQYEFDPNDKKVSCYSIFYGNKVTKSMLNDYIQRNFHDRDPDPDDTYYIKNFIKDGKECYVWLSPDFPNRTIRYFFRKYN